MSNATPEPPRANVVCLLDWIMAIARTIRERIPVSFAFLCAATVAFLAGCPIPQPPGQGTTKYCTCRTTDRNYWLYLPKDINHERRYPLVVSLHGMKPYDISEHHVKMWGDLADKHGFIILAPELQTSDALGQFPLRKMGSAEAKDVQHVLACMDEVIPDYPVDPNEVFLSCWSMGGYLAHFIAAEYGQRFAAFAPLQSNFCNEILNPVKARQHNRLPVFVFYGTTDFGVVSNEAKDSIEWYSKLGFDVTVKKADVPHQRHPELAAEFFEGILAKNRKPIEIVITPPVPDPAPLAVNLWPALSSKIGEVRTYIWDFGKLGGPSYLKSPNVLIRQPGEYPIRLTVVDKAGQKYIADTRLKVPAMRSAQGNPITATGTP